MEISELHLYYKDIHLLKYKLWTWENRGLKKGEGYTKLLHRLDEIFKNFL